MIGKYTHNVDPKGRLFVPAKLRDELGDVFYVAIGTENNLLVYPEEKWNAVEARYNATSIHENGRLRFFFANVSKCEPDKQGRFVIPLLLRQYAHLNGDVTFLGQGDHAEIWDTATYEEKEAEFLSSPENLLNALKELNL